MTWPLEGGSLLTAAQRRQTVELTLTQKRMDLRCPNPDEVPLSSAKVRAVAARR